ncbi:MAG: hypothetical protein ACI8T1_001912 [Verrucomicrobiales bacterium]|jgi:hypothetical protein
MPFTISHAGFVLPFRRYLNGHLLFAVVVGSMMPDVPYFVRGFGVASYAHTFLGAVVVSLPLGLCAYWIGIQLFREMTDLLPMPHRGWASTTDLYQKRNAVSWLGVSCALIGGAWSHNFLDSFTHDTGLAVSFIPFLAESSWVILRENFPNYRLLQYGGSIVGLCMLLIAYTVGLRRYCKKTGSMLWADGTRWAALLGLLMGSILIAGSLHVHRLADGLNSLSLRSFGFLFLITLMPVYAIGLIAMALRARWRKR